MRRGCASKGEWVRVCKDGSRAQGGHRQQVWTIPEPGVAPRAGAFQAEELEGLDELGPRPTALSSLSFLLCQREKWPVCPLPSPDAGRGLGASRSPQGNICTFQTHVVSGGGECQAPVRHPHPCAGRRTGNRAWGERALEGPLQRLCNPLLPSQQWPPPSGRTGRAVLEERRYPTLRPTPRAPWLPPHPSPGAPETQPGLACPLHGGPTGLISSARSPPPPRPQELGPGTRGEATAL